MWFQLHEMGQALAEYAIIMVLIIVLVIVFLLIIGPAVGDMFSNVVNSI